jgi:hypothetical protein
LRQRQDVRGDRRAGAAKVLGPLQMGDGGSRPDGPVTQEASGDMDPVAGKIESGQQIEQDIVVIPGVERDLAA